MTEIVSFFGVDLTQIAMVSGLVFTGVEWAKKKFPTFFVGGWKTELVAVVISLGISFKVAGPNWESVLILAALGWIVPGGAHLAMKKK